jgi:acetylornithine deacetylase/succinyl-diaminopimelate desuccinylase-like protein
MTTLQAPVKPFLDWKSATAETVENLQRLVRIDTTNPPGNELPAVLLVKEFLLQNGFPEENIQVLEAAPGRANLVARLRGDGSKLPLLLSGHVDVVPVERSHWSHDPFGGEIDGGYVWGRGTLDMKGFVSMYLETFLQAFRQGKMLKRDLIFAAIADEENGFNFGSKFLAGQHKDLINAEYGITEGGAMTIHMGKLRTYPIQVAEKGVTWLRMTAEGEPGHGSMPHANNAVLHLAQAIDRIRKVGHLPIHLTPTFLRMIDAIAAQLPFPTSLIGPLLHNRTTASLVLRLVPEKSRSLAGPLFYNTVTPTVLKAGGKTNVIPSLAEAQLDCRILPGQTPEDVIREIQAVVGPDVKLEILTSSTGAEFSTDNEMYRLMAKATQAMDPGGLVFPMLMMGATDACQYKNAGIQMYGFTPGLLPKDFPSVSLAHGHDERIPLSYVESGLPVLWQVVEEICA